MATPGRILLRTLLKERRSLVRSPFARKFSALPEKNSVCSDELIKAESQHSAHNYHPIPMVFSQAKGTCVWDPEGNKYLDFLSAYSAVNQGHYHPKVVKALVEKGLHMSASTVDPQLHLLLCDCIYSYSIHGCSSPSLV